MCSLASLKLPWCCPTKQGPWGHHARERLDAQLSGISIPMQSMEGRTGWAQDISPGYLTYLVRFYGNITFYSHPSLHFSLTSLAAISRWYFQCTQIPYEGIEILLPTALVHFPRKVYKSLYGPASNDFTSCWTIPVIFTSLVTTPPTDTVRWHQCHANYFIFINDICRGDLKDNYLFQLSPYSGPK